MEVRVSLFVFLCVSLALILSASVCACASVCAQRPRGRAQKRVMGCPQTRSERAGP